MQEQMEMEIPADDAGKFYIKSDDDAFQGRQMNAFNCLNDLEVKHEQFKCASTLIDSYKADDASISSSDDESPPSSSIAAVDTASDEGGAGQSQFRFRPPQQIPPRRCTPYSRSQRQDHLTNPGKWTKYSLEDVTGEHMSDETNTKAALQFLQERAALRRHDGDDGDGDLVGAEPAVEPHQPVRFNSAAARLRSSAGTNLSLCKSKFQAGKWAMPEYVVGQKVQNDAKKPRIKNVNSDSTLDLSGHVQLSHIQPDSHSTDIGIEKTLVDTCAGTASNDMVKFKAVHRGKRAIRTRRDADDQE